jgi:hypothetical protein
VNQSDRDTVAARVQHLGSSTESVRTTSLPGDQILGILPNRLESDALARVNSSGVRVPSSR